MTKEEFEEVKIIFDKRNELENKKLKTQQIFKNVLPNSQLPILTSMEVNILRESLLLQIGNINDKLYELNSKIDSYFDK